MSTFGRKVLTKTGRDVMVLADLQDAQFKVGGITIDWTTVTAADDDAVLTDQTPIAEGEKYLRFGQVLCKITTGGKFGPYDPDATDGREQLNRGDCFILNFTVKENGFVAGLNNTQTDHPQVFDGGTVWKDRLLVSGDTDGLETGPLFVDFEAAFPRIAYATN